MPESKVRQSAKQKMVEKRREDAATKQDKNATLAARLAGSRDWVPWVFIPLGLLGVAWLLVYYVAGDRVPGMSGIGSWNFLIGIVLIASAFVVATLWK